MNTNKIYLFVIVALLTVISGTKAEIDCSDRPPFVHPKDCCKINLITDQIKEKCGGKGGNNEGFPGPPSGMDGEKGPHGINRHGKGHHHGHHRGPHCFFSCVLNETGIMIDGELQEDNLKVYLDETLNDPETIDILSNNFVKCSEKMANMLEKKGPPHGHGGRGGGRHGPPHRHCTSGNGKVMGCAMMETFKECPESIWADTEECNAVRDYWNECHPTPSDDTDVVEDEEGEDEEVEYEEEEDKVEI